jgi:hypothetical protein
MANPLGDSPAVSANPLGDSAVVGNPLGDQPVVQQNPLGDQPTVPSPAQSLSPLGQLVEKAKAEPDSSDTLNIAKFAFTHPIDFFHGMEKAVPAAAAAYPALSERVFEEAQKPNINLPRMDTSQPGIEGIGAGVVNTGEKIVEGVNTPAMLPLLGAGAVMAPLASAGVPAAQFALRSLGAYFAASSLHTAAQQAKVAGQVAANPQSTPGQVTEAVLDPLASAAMGFAAGKMVRDASPEPTKPYQPPITSESTSDAFGYLDMTRTNAVQQWVNTDNPARTLVAAKDAVDSATERSANAARIDVLHDLEGNFSEADMPAARRALVPAVESGMDPEVLREMNQKLSDAKYKTPEAASAAAGLQDSISFALEHMDDLSDAVDKHNAITTAIYDHAQDSGIEFPKRDNYVLHEQDFEPPQGFAAPPGGGSGSAAFSKMRTAGDTYADSIANGVVPRTLDGPDLLAQSVRRTLGRVNNNLWTDALQGMRDPTNGAAIVVPRTAVTRPDGSSYLDTPPGYQATEVGGRPMAIQNGYAGLFDAMTDASKVPETLSKINGTAKSVILAIDTYHLGRLAFYQAASELSRGEAPVPTYQKGLLLGDTPMSVIEDMAKKGDIDPSQLPQIREDKAIIDMGINAGLPVGRIADSLHQEWVQATPVLGDVNKFIFQQFQRGAIYDMFVKEFRYQAEQRPDLSSQEIARQVANNVSTRLGNLGNRSVFNKVMGQTGADLARLGVLAPQWNEALVRSELGGVGQLVGAVPRALQTGRFTPGLLGRTAATLVVGTFAANQVINMMTRGHPTWENPEEGLGSKVSAWIPDFIGKGPGFFLNPFTLPFEVSHLLMKTWSATGDWRDAVDQYFRGRVSAIGRVVAGLATKKDSMGQPISTMGALAGGIPLPISAGSAYNAAKQVVTGTPSETFPGQFQKQAMSTFGVRTDQAPSPEQRIKALATNFNQAHGVEQNAEFYGGDYVNLRRALTVGNVREANSELTNILTKKTPAQVEQYFQRYWAFPFTGSQGKERAFYGTLNDEQAQEYHQARTDRQQLSMQAMQLLRAHMAAKSASPSQ